jgi:hypothetical protein
MPFYFINKKCLSHSKDALEAWLSKMIRKDRVKEFIILDLKR